MLLNITVVVFPDTQSFLFYVIREVDKRLQLASSAESQQPKGEVPTLEECKKLYIWKSLEVLENLEAAMNTEEQNRASRIAEKKKVDIQTQEKIRKVVDQDEVPSDYADALDLLSLQVFT
jgi:hypothetical protein